MWIVYGDEPNFTIMFFYRKFFNDFGINVVLDYMFVFTIGSRENLFTSSSNN